MSRLYHPYANVQGSSTSSCSTVRLFFPVLHSFGGNQTTRKVPNAKPHNIPSNVVTFPLYFFFYRQSHASGDKIKLRHCRYVFFVGSCSSLYTVPLLRWVLANILQHQQARLTLQRIIMIARKIKCCQHILAQIFYNPEYEHHHGLWMGEDRFAFLVFTKVRRLVLQWQAEHKGKPPPSAMAAIS